MLFYKLLLAHVLGDFVLQSNRWVEHKRKEHFKSPYLYIHGCIHGILTLLLILPATYNPWRIVAVISISHILIDGLKGRLDGTLNPRQLFWIDQALHLVVLFYCVVDYRGFLGFIPAINWELLLLAVVLLTTVSSRVIQIIMSRWRLPEDDPEASLPKTGAYIGILERLFVFGFILLQQWSVIGLLIAAKSVFRFSDLSRAKDRKLTEYILIGRLLSFGLAILIGLGYIKVNESISY